MQTVWTAHIKDKDEKLQYEKSLRHSKWILDRLNDILVSVESGLNRQEASPRAYDTPNWDYRQAHANGFRQCLYQIKDIINLDQKESNDRKHSSSQ